MNYLRKMILVPENEINSLCDIKNDEYRLPTSTAFSQRPETLFQFSQQLNNLRELDKLLKSNISPALKMKLYNQSLQSLLSFQRKLSQKINKTPSALVSEKATQVPSFYEDKEVQATQMSPFYEDKEVQASPQMESIEMQTEPEHVKEEEEEIFYESIPSLLREVKKENPIIVKDELEQSGIEYKIRNIVKKYYNISADDLLVDKKSKKVVPGSNYTEIVKFILTPSARRQPLPVGADQVLFVLGINHFNPDYISNFSAKEVLGTYTDDSKRKTRSTTKLEKSQKGSGIIGYVKRRNKFFPVKWLSVKE